MASNENASVIAAFEASPVPTILISEDRVVIVSNYAAQTYLAPWLTNAAGSGGGTGNGDPNALQGLCLADLPIGIEKDDNSTAEVDTWLDEIEHETSPTWGDVQQKTQVVLRPRHGGKRPKSDSASQDRHRATLTAVIWPFQGHQNYTLTISAPESTPLKPPFTALDRKLEQPRARSGDSRSNGSGTFSRSTRPGFARAPSSSIASTQGNRPLAIRSSTASSILKEKDARNVSWEAQAASPIRPTSRTSSMSPQMDVVPEAIDTDTFATFRDAIFYSNERPGFILSADYHFGKSEFTAYCYG